MFCRYCGTQVPDDSVFCASCGKNLGVTPARTTPANPVAAKSTGQRKLVLRRSKQFLGSAVNLAILIDGVEAVRIKNGEEKTIMISTEGHALAMLNDAMGGHRTRDHVISAGTGNVHAYIQPVKFKTDWSIIIEYM